MQLQQPFDARQVDPSLFPVPPMADYHVHIVESEAKPSSNGTGGYVEFTFNIDDPGQWVGAKIPYRLNLYHNDPNTVRMAYAQLSALCHVTGVFSVQDTRQLHGVPFIATIGPQTKNPQYANVFVVKDANGNVPGKPSATPQPTAVAPAPAWGPSAPAAPQAPAPPPAYGAPAWGPPAPAAPPAAGWGPPSGTPVPPAAPNPAAPSGWGPPAPAAPPAYPPAAPAAGWGPPAAAAPPSAYPPPAAAAPPAWGPPTSTVPPAPPAYGAPPAAPNGAPPTAPPWVR